MTVFCSAPPGICVLGAVFTVFVGCTMTVFGAGRQMACFMCPCFAGGQWLSLYVYLYVVVVYTMVVCMVPVLRRLGNV